MKRLLVVLYLLPSLVFAEGVQLGTNLIPLAMDGWSVHGGLEILQLRIEFFGGKREDKFHLEANEAFEVKGRLTGFYIDYTGPKSEGLFGGAGLYRNRAKFRLESTNQKVVRDFDYLSLRLGHKWPIQERFFVTPWVQYDMNIGQKRSVVLSGQVYQTEDWIVLPGILIGVQI